MSLFTSSALKVLLPALVIMAKLHSPRTSTYEISVHPHAYNTQSSVVKGTVCLLYKNSLRDIIFMII